MGAKLKRGPSKKSHLSCSDMIRTCIKVVMAGLLFATAAQAEEAPDPLDVAATLIKDGYYDRAKEVLGEADIDVQPFDFKRLYTRLGVLSHHRGYPDVSNIYIENAISMGQDNLGILLYMAKNHFQLQQFESVIKTLEKAGEAAQNEPQMFVMKAEAHKNLDDHRSAWNVLDQGISKFPEYTRFYLQKFYYLVELGFYEKALEYADQYLKREDYTEKEFLAVSYSLRAKGEPEKAAQLLEEAVLRHPHSEQLIELLGQVYVDQEYYLAAATVFDQASIVYPKFAHKAAALFLKAKQPVRSLQLNRRIADQKSKFQQRLSIDIYLEDYESLAAKTDALKRYGLLEQDDILYAVGYAHFRNQDYENATQYLKQITDGEMFARASSIFGIIERCRNEPVQCL